MSKSKTYSAQIIPDGSGFYVIFGYAVGDGHFNAAHSKPSRFYKSARTAARAAAAWEAKTDA